VEKTEKIRGCSSINSLGRSGKQMFSLDIKNKRRNHRSHGRKRKHGHDSGSGRGSSSSSSALTARTTNISGAAGGVGGGKSGNAHAKPLLKGVVACLTGLDPHEKEYYHALVEALGGRSV